MKRLISISWLAAAGLAAACGGAAETELFGPTETSTGETVPSAPTTSASTTPPSASSDGGFLTNDAGPLGPKPVGPPVVACGRSTTCAVPKQVCCATEPPDAGAFELACIDAATSHACAGIPIACDDKSDCAAGHVCCGTYDSNGYKQIACQSSCTSNATLSAVRFCNPKAAVDECLEIGRKCGASQSLPYLFVCK